MKRIIPTTITLGIAALAALALIPLPGCGGGTPPPLSSSTFVLSGTVTDGHDRPIPTAAVALNDTPLGAVTDSLGRFGISPVRPGNYMMVVLYLGYRTEPVLVRARDAGATTVTVPFRRDAALGPALVDSLGSARIAFTLERSP